MYSYVIRKKYKVKKKKERKSEEKTKKNLTFSPKDTLSLTLREKD